MNLHQAKKLAQETADHTNQPTIVFQWLLRTDVEDYDVSFGAVPENGVRIGGIYQPIRKKAA